MRMSNRRTFWISGHLRFSPGLVITSFTSPNWNTMAFWRWSTVNSTLEATSTSATRTAMTGPRVLTSALPPLAAAQCVARARACVRRRRRLGRGALRGLGLAQPGDARLLHQLVERQVQEVPAALVVDDDLRGRGQDLLQGLDVDALARHGRRLRVLGEHLAETRGFAHGIGDDARLVAIG